MNQGKLTRMDIQKVLYADSSFEDLNEIVRFFKNQPLKTLLNLKVLDQPYKGLSHLKSNV